MRSPSKMMRAVCVAALLPAVLGGCTMAPRYARPEPQLPANWNSGAVDAGLPGAQALEWPQVVTDPAMKNLVDLAIKNNRDLRVAALNVIKAEAQHQITRADLMPKIDATAGSSSTRTPASLTGVGHPVTSRSYSVGLGFTSFELDLFGRIQSLKAQALEQFLATEATRKSVELSLVAQVATGYLTLAADREHLALAHEILDTETASYELQQHRFQNGVINELDLSQARTTVENARINVAKYASQVVQDENALSVLVGMPLTADMAPAQRLDEIAPLTPVPAGLPSEVLTRRPDIIAAEHQLKAANAYIGAARAAYFPSISLTGSYGTSSNAVNGLFKNGSVAWSFVPNITLPIFHGGAIAAGVKASEADRDIYVAQYEKAVQTAFKEVSDALSSGTSLDAQVNAQESLAKATAKSYELSTLRYENGVDSFITKLDAQRTNASARQDLITVRLSKTANTLTLFKVLGGGWKEEPAELAAPKTADASRPGSK
jgi:multidrug efflux system outer membrane protein